MDAIWTIAYGTINQTLDKAGISGLKRQLVSRASDVVTFDFPGAFDYESGLAWGQKVTISKGAAIWFVGYVTTLPRVASGEEESTSIRLEGPWWHLEQLVFQQVWKIKTGSNQFIQQNNAHLLLNLKQQDLTLVSTGTQIKAALQYLLDRFQAAGREKPFQIGNVTPALFPAIDEVRDVTCAEVIRKQLRWHPDATAWFDYSTNPPTFHCRPWNELAAVNIAVGQTSGFDLTPRYDLQRAVVAIRYERKNSIDGQEFLTIVNDVYPPGATGLEPGALTATIDLQGAKITNLKAELVTEAIPADLLDLNWWKQKVPELANPNIGPITITESGRAIKNPDGSTLPTDGLPFEVIEGQVAPWMKILAQQERISIKEQHVLYDREMPDPNAVPLQSLSDPVTHTYDCVTTTGLSGGYRAVGSLELGDPQPIGLAQALWTALQVLHFDGSITVVEAEVGDSLAASMGNVLNLPGGRPEWVAMKALVQEVSEDVDSGKKTFNVGSPAHLGAPDLAELLRVNRGRIRWTNPDAVDGGAIGSNEMSLGKETANSSRGVSDKPYNLWVVKSGAVAVTADCRGGGRLSMLDGAKGVDLQVGACFGGNAARVLTVQEVAFCMTNPDGTKTIKHRLAVVSDLY